MSLDGPLRRALILDGVIAGLLAVTLVCWFGAWPSFLPPLLPAVALLATLAFRYSGLLGRKL